MTRVTPLGHPLLLGFDDIERLLERAGKAGDGYPPYNIERIGTDGGEDLLRITLAVAGFSRDQLEITVEDRQLTIRGRQTDDGTDEARGRVFLHRGIAARQFQRAFVLADGIEVRGAELKHGLLSVELVRPEPQRRSRQIAIVSHD